MYVIANILRRFWALAAIFAGFYIASSLSIQGSECIGFGIGLIIYFGGLAIFRNASNNESSTTNNNLPSLTESDIEKIRPFSNEIFQRVDAGEKLDIVAQSVALRAKVDPIQVVAYAVGVAQALKDFKKGLDGSK